MSEFNIGDRVIVKQNFSMREIDFSDWINSGDSGVVDENHSFPSWIGIRWDKNYVKKSCLELECILSTEEKVLKKIKELDTKWAQKQLKKGRTPYALSLL